MTGCILPTWRLPGAKTCPERTSEYRQRPYDNRLERCAVDPTRIGCIQVRACVDDHGGGGGSLPLHWLQHSYGVYVGRLSAVT